MKPKNEKALNIYGRVPTSLLRDARVSLKAKALYAYIDDKPDDWHFSSARIARETK